MFATGVWCILSRSGFPTGFLFVYYRMIGCFRSVDNVDVGIRAELDLHPVSAERDQTHASIQFLETIESAHDKEMAVSPWSCF
jgi:hypothetical protein